LAVWVVRRPRMAVLRFVGGKVKRISRFSDFLQKSVRRTNQEREQVLKVRRQIEEIAIVRDEELRPACQGCVQKNIIIRISAFRVTAAEANPGRPPIFLKAESPLLD
jgi:hypothetical protein